jgi:hypothetical protein
VKCRLTHAYAENSRGIAVADMACALLRPAGNTGLPGELAFHALDVMLGFGDSARAGGPLQDGYNL